MTKQDTKIRELQRQITEKENALEKIANPKYLTNRVYKLYSTTFNLNVLKEEELNFLWLRFKIMQDTAEEYGIEYVHDGEPVEDILHDITLRKNVLTYRKQTEELAKAKQRLSQLLSDEAKLEDELTSIASLLS